MDVNKTQQMMLYVAEHMVRSEPELTVLDQVVGDGDHGLGIQRGFAAITTLLQNDKFQAKDVGDVFTQIGTKLMTSMGGASGAIFGTLFRAGGKGMTNASVLDTHHLALFLNEGWKAVFMRGSAKPGDKTMIDALSAAANEATACGNEPLNIALVKITNAAMEGAEKTKEMVAAFGRAKSLGDRVLGHKDPGAASMALIIKFMQEFSQKN